MNEKELAAVTIRKLNQAKNLIERCLDAIGRKHVPDYHFLDHSISTTWTCDQSPIGYCVFLRVDMRLDNCIFCRKPTERK